MTVLRLLGRTEAFKVKAIFLGEIVRTKEGVIGGGEVKPRNRKGRLLIKSRNRISTRHDHFLNKLSLELIARFFLKCLKSRPVSKFTPSSS